MNNAFPNAILSRPWPTIYDPVLSQCRWEDRSTGEFTSFDTFQGDNDNPITLNKYLYAGANPIEYSDPSGHDLAGLLTTIAIGGVIVAIGGGIAGFAYATAYRSLPIFSLKTLEYTVGGIVGGGVVGALLGGAGYIATTAGAEGGVALLRSGTTQLLSKLAGTHSTTAGISIAGFAVGLVAGLVHPDPDIIAAGAAAIFALGSTDVLTRGIMRDRDLLTGVFGATGYLAARTILFKYVQSSSFYAIGFTVGFTAGYTIGYEVRTHLID